MSWFKIELKDKKLLKSSKVREWLKIVNKRMEESIRKGWRMVPTVQYIDTRKNKEFLCMHADARVLFNLIDQKVKFKELGNLDCIVPRNESRMSAIKSLAQNIIKHIDGFSERNELFF